MKGLGFVFILLFCLTLSAQESDIKSYLGKIENATLGLETNGDVVFLEYRVETLSADGTSGSEKAKIIKNDKMLEFYSNDYQMFKDNDNIVVIQKSQKQILIIPYTDDMINVIDANRYYEQKDSLLANTQVVKVDDEILDSKGTRNVLLHMDRGCMEGIYIQNMLYSVNVKENALKAIITTYYPGFELLKMKTIVTQYKRMKRYRFRANAIQYVFNRNGTLRSEYRAYIINDNR